MPRTNSQRRAAGPPFSRRVFAAALALLFAAAAQARAPRQSAAPKRITTAAGVRLRAAPDAGSDEVARLQLGSVVEELERSRAKSKVAAAEDFWYMVSAPGGARGWVFGALTAPFDPARREEIYARLADERLASANATFNDAAELVGFAERAAREVTRRDARAGLEFARLRALARSLNFVTGGGEPGEPFKRWVTERAEEVVYSEPSGEWYVRADLFWDLQAKYKDLALGERIAWEGAQTPLPGECEGDLSCGLYYLSATKGRYLKLYPRGPHAAEALKGIEELADAVVKDSRSANPVYTVPPAADADFKRTLATLRAQLTPARTPRAARVLRRLDLIARLSRRRR